MLFFSIPPESLLCNENVTFCLFQATLSVQQRPESAVADEEGFYETHAVHFKFELALVIRVNINT